MLTTTAPIQLNGTTWTKVLSVQGFALSDSNIRVAWTPTIPPANVEGLWIKAGQQIETTEDGIWAKSANATSVAYVTAVEVT